MDVGFGLSLNKTWQTWQKQNSSKQSTTLSFCLSYFAYNPTRQEILKLHIFFYFLEIFLKFFITPRDAVKICLS